MSELRQGIQNAQNFAGLKGHMLELLERVENLEKAYGTLLNPAIPADSVLSAPGPLRRERTRSVAQADSDTHVHP